MAMRVDTAKARKALYGITMGMTNQELVQYSGYGIYTIRIIRKNPEKYKKSAPGESKEGRRTEEKKRVHFYIQRRICPGMGRNNEFD